MEFRHRRLLAQAIINSGQVDPADKRITGYLYNIPGMEKSFGIMNPDAQSSIRIGTMEKDGLTLIALDNNEALAACAYSDEYVPENLKQSMERAMNYGFMVHAGAKDVIKQSGKILKYIEFSYMESMFDNMRKYTLVKQDSITAGPADYMKGLKYRTSSGNEALDSALSAAIASGRLDMKKLSADTSAFVKASRAANNYFDVFLAMLEYSFITGTETKPETMNSLMPYLRKIPGAMTLINTMTDQELKPELKAKEITGIDRTGLKKGYVMDVLVGGFLSDPDPQTAIKYFLKALKKNPKITGCWVDMGNAYAWLFESPQTWACYDAAYYIYPGHRFLAPVTEMKNNLENGFPGFF